MMYFAEPFAHRRPGESGDNYYLFRLEFAIHEDISPDSCFLVLGYRRAICIWLHVNIPTGDFEKTHKTGFGVSSAIEFSIIPKLAGHVGYGWTTYDSKSSSTGSPFPVESIDVWEFGAGARYAFGLLYVGLEGDYYSKIEEWGILPEVGIRFRDFDAGVRFKAGGDRTGSAYPPATAFSEWLAGDQGQSFMTQSVFTNNKLRVGNEETTSTAPCFVRPVDFIHRNDDGRYWLHIWIEAQRRVG